MSGRRACPPRVPAQGRNDCIVHTLGVHEACGVGEKLGERDNLDAVVVVAPTSPVEQQRTRHRVVLAKQA